MRASNASKQQINKLASKASKQSSKQGKQANKQGKQTNKQAIKQTSKQARQIIKYASKQTSKETRIQATLNTNTFLVSTPARGFYGIYNIILCIHICM